MAKESKAKSSPTTEKKKKEYKLDLFGQVLPALYRGDTGFYARQEPAAQKEISPLLLMRWVSLAAGLESIAPGFVNSHVNAHFWRISRHPELQWKELCVVASTMRSTPPRSTWMMPKKKISKTPIIDGYLEQLYPLQSEFELEIVKSKITNEEEVKDLVRSFGGSDQEIKDIVKEYRAHYGKES